MGELTTLPRPLVGLKGSTSKEGRGDEGKREEGREGEEDMKEKERGEKERGGQWRGEGMGGQGRGGKGSERTILRIPCRKFLATPLRCCAFSKIMSALTDLF